MAKKAGPKKNSRYLPMDTSRRMAFLRALRDSGGSFAAACRASAPHLEDTARNPPAYTSWRNLIKRDPEFAEQVEEVMQEIRDDIEEELHRRSVKGVPTGVYQKAQRVFEPKLDDNGQPILDDKGQPIMVAASVTRYSDALLLRRAAALMPEKYSEKREININHVTNTKGQWTITTDDLVALNEVEEKQLLDIMKKVRGYRTKSNNQIEHKSDNIVDTEGEISDDDYYANIYLVEGNIDA